MFVSMGNQLRYSVAVLLGRRLPTESLDRIVRDLVATLDEFGEPGDNSPPLLDHAASVDPEIRARLTARSMKATIRHAAAETSYYRKVFAESGLHPDDITPATLDRLPVTQKRALRGSPGLFVSDRANPVFMARSTGTTGTPTVVWFSRYELAVLSAINTIASVIGHGIRRHHVIGWAGSSRATLPLMLSKDSAVRVGASFVHLGFLDPHLTLDRLATPVDLPGKAGRITHLITSASYLAALVEAAESTGRRSCEFGLTSIEVAGEVCSTPLRQRAAAALGAPVTTSYMATEIVPAGAVQCSAGHMHFRTEYGHVEVLDPETFEPAGPGQLGVLVITPFVPYRDCTLLLRYVTGDLVRTLAAPAGCELAYAPATSDILGRYLEPLTAAVPTRAVLDLLDGERGIPLPARFAVVDDPAGPLLHVWVRGRDNGLLARLDERAGQLGLALAGIVTHTDRAGLPPTEPVRADLREHTFEAYRPADRIVGMAR
jgi:phenylacetate-coenzyme A ligase PaaK-like adenylate-forming protein